jgi:Tfp pilus assembly protein PilF
LHFGRPPAIAGGLVIFVLKSGILLQSMPVEDGPAMTQCASRFRPAVKTALLLAGWLTVGTAHAQFDPQHNLRAYFDLGMASIIAGHFAEAKVAFDKAIDIDPMNDRAFAYRCLVRAATGSELQHALVDCNEVLRLNPNNIFVFEARGLTFLKLGEFDRSIVDFDRMLSFRPYNAASRYGRGLAKLRKGDAAEGEFDLMVATAIRPEIVEQFARYGLSR